ncbi:hypothetical protein DAI22_03g141700 [Oryza sativa Japonica Group]|nr:hypothetical protein DAI22_03g141700 [Oryza sativa Japonica Group]
MNIKYENSIKASVINPAKPKPKAPVYQLTEGTNTLFQDKPHDMLPKTWSCQGQILTPGRCLLHMSLLSFLLYCNCQEKLSFGISVVI